MRGGKQARSEICGVTIPEGLEPKTDPLVKAEGRYRIRKVIPTETEKTVNSEEFPRKKGEKEITLAARFRLLRGTR